MCRPRGEVVHVRLEILDNSRLVGGRDVGTGVVKGERTDGGVVCLEDGFKIERQPVPGREFPTRGTGQYTTTLRRPLRTTSGWEKTDDTRMKGTNCDGIHWTSNFVRGCVDEFCAERRRGVVRVGLWR
jgi:hypothetical protein